MDNYTENCFYAKCDIIGEIKFISENNLKPFDSINQKVNLIQSILELGGDDISDFFEEAAEMGYAVSKPIILKEYSRDKKYFITASKTDHNLSICISDKPIEGKNRIFDELLKLNNELTNRIRLMSKADSNQTSRNSDRVFYDDLTKLNNEIISTQRKLYKEIAQRKKAEDHLKQSESRYRLLADNSTDIIILHDIEGNISYVSPSVQNLLFYSPWEIESENFFDLIQSDYKYQFDLAFDKTTEVDESIRIEHKITRKDQTTIWVETISKKVEGRSKTDSSGLIISVIRDISSRKIIEEEVNDQHIEIGLQNEELLKAQKELEILYFKYFQLFESAPVGYFNLDQNMTIINANITVVDVLKQPLHEIIGRQFIEFIHTESLSDFRDTFEKSLISDIIEKQEVRFFKKSEPNDECYALIELVAIENNDSDHKNLQMALMDISERYKAEKQLSESEKQLREANNAKDRFFSIIAHDLKSPFNGVLGLLDYILQSKDSISKTEVIDICGLLHDAVNRQYNLTEDLLFWARSNTGRLKINKTTFELYNAINDIKESLNQSINDKNIKFINDISDDFTLLADVNLTMTILRNLISNAVKFTPEGGSIRVYNNQRDGINNIFVEDNGVGIEHKDMNKLFKIDEVFSTPGTNSENGTGLGLIICQEFADKQGGSIAVESQVGSGSIFTLRLPNDR